MLFTFFLDIIGLILQIFHLILGAIPLAPPAAIQESFTSFGSYLAYASGIIDIKGVFSAFNFLVQFLIAFFSFKIFMFFYHLVRGSQSHPDAHHTIAQKK